MVRGRCLAQVIGLLDELNMSKDDYDTLTAEFGLTGYSKDTIRIDGRVKSALTRQYNKGHKEVQKVKSSADDEGVGSDEEGGEPPAARAKNGETSRLDWLVRVRVEQGVTMMGSWWTRRRRPRPRSERGARERQERRSGRRRNESNGSQQERMLRPVF